MVYAAIGAIVFTLVSLVKAHSLEVNKSLPCGNCSWPTWMNGRLTAVFFFFSCAPVPGLPHPAPDREQEALHQPRGVCVCSSLHLRGHCPDLPVPPTAHWGLKSMSLRDSQHIFIASQLPSANLCIALLFIKLH